MIAVAWGPSADSSMLLRSGPTHQAPANSAAAITADVANAANTDNMRQHTQPGKSSVPLRSQHRRVKTPGIRLEQEAAFRPVLSTGNGHMTCQTWHEKPCTPHMYIPQRPATILPGYQPLCSTQTAGAFQSFWHLHLGLLPPRTEPRHSDQEGVMHMQKPSHHAMAAAMAPMRNRARMLHMPPCILEQRTGKRANLVF